MAIRKYKPTTPARRHMTVSKFEGIDKKAKPERSLTEVLNKKGGRNNYGRITVRHRGGGGKKIYRIIDFKRDKEGQATVLRLEYDPNRSANIALIQYEDGTKAYIIAQSGLKAGDVVESGPAGQIGNEDHGNIHIGKAGRKRHMGIRPTVRGSVMNPNDHPHGGGEGRAPIGRPGPVTPWGKPALGYKTRKKKNRTEKFIVRHRNAK